MKVIQLFKMAIKSIIGNKIRSILTMLGIIIGIASVIILVAMGQGTTKQVQDSIQSMGTNLITVSVVGNRNEPVTTKELDQLKTKPGIADISPTLTQNVNLAANDQTTSTSAQAVEPNFATIRNMSVESGRFINQSDLDNRYHSAVVGTEVATSLFNTTNVVGQTISVNGVDFNIVGVLTSMGTSSAGSSDNTILLPLTTAQRLLKTTQVKTFYVQASSSSSVDNAMSYLQIFLDKKYSLPISSSTTATNKYFRVMNETSLLQTATSTQQSMTNMLSGVAAISLVVGGIGIMNIMLVSVMERTREIGIRKALGAKRKAILLQFLIEAVFISGIGGIIGVLIGIGGGQLLKTYNHTAIQLSGTVILAAFAFSVTVGVVFGLYPANKASKLNPIDALSYE
ncbi:ABC transporter permease [Clostridium pasteurianum]|uniref:ABC-type transport system, involved in lipoprotein release, permease component n=1 Tax=Clostridium pasteurianum BC1 TaxID=86416 RepID=R4KCV9_CLOPA|nr:ABC transporter permease [Clostridium pasteurianum]AGK99501.1 ABC-type transport system, involved in lipoprotein release, permease component [Clostridium pasteurianum BC1]